MDDDSIKQTMPAILKPREHSLEVTGLGVIASVLIAFWSLVGDGTLRLSEYLVFVVFLLVGAGALVWRIMKLTPARKPKFGEPHPPLN